MIDIRPTMSVEKTAVRMWMLSAVIACALPACSTTRTLTEQAGTSQQSAVYANCILPGQVRQLGTRLTYLTPRRPASLSEQECQSRGGQFVVAEKEDQAPIQLASGEVEIRWSEVTPKPETVYSAVGVVMNDAAKKESESSRGD